MRLNWLIALAVATAPFGGAIAAPTETIIHDFNVATGLGVPITGLALGQDGTLYGTTFYGPGVGSGGVFKLAPPKPGETRWTGTTLYKFHPQTDGYETLASPVLGADGALYGVNFEGGGGCPASAVNCGGTVFRLGPGGRPWAVLHRFSGGDDGALPDGSVVVDQNGAVYGTTSYGGGAGCTDTGGCGIVFKLNPPAAGGTTWTETVLYRFRGYYDGANPRGVLALDDNGTLYGTTLTGGDGNTGCDGNGCGTVYSLTPPAPGASLWQEEILYRFPGSGPGSGPDSGVVRAPDGTLFGSTVYGGICSGDGCGTVFKVTPPIAGTTNWTEQVLYKFQGSPDGAAPGVNGSGLTLAADGSIYGMTYDGGNCCGTVFKLTPPTQGGTKWTETVLHRFIRSVDGAYGSGGLVVNSSGNLFGTTSVGGTFDSGTVFKIRP